MDVLDRLRGGLVVSCQPVADWARPGTWLSAAMAAAAVAGGASGVRIEGLRNLQAARPRLSVPIIALVKRDDPVTGGGTGIGAAIALQLAEAGADVVAYDATDRPRNETREAVLRSILSGGCIAMADCATLDDARIAGAAGAQIVGSTLSGYTQASHADESGPDLALVRQLAELPHFVVAEGRYNTPDLAARAMAAGADAVTVGTALTRLEHMTDWFCEAVNTARRS